MWLRQRAGRLPRIRKSTDASWKTPFGSKCSVACTTALRPTVTRECGLRHLSRSCFSDVIRCHRTNARDNALKVDGIQLEHARAFAWLVPNAVRSDFASGGRLGSKAYAEGGVPVFQQLGNGAVPSLRRREGLGEKDADWELPSKAIRRRCRRSCRRSANPACFCSRMPGDGPAISCVLAKIDVGHERPELGVCGVKQADRLLRPRTLSLSRRSAICKGFLDHALYQLIVFDDQDHNLVFQR